MTPDSQNHTPQKHIEHRSSAEWVVSNNDFPKIFSALASNIGTIQEFPFTVLSQNGPEKIQAHWKMYTQEANNKSELWITVVLEPQQIVSKVGLPQPATHLDLRAELDKTPIEVTGFYFNQPTPEHHTVFKNVRESFFGIDTAWAQWLANFSKKSVFRSVYPLDIKMESLVSQKPGFIQEDFYGDSRYVKHFEVNSPENTR